MHTRHLDLVFDVVHVARLPRPRLAGTTMLLMSESGLGFGSVPGFGGSGADTTTTSVAVRAMDLKSFNFGVGSLRIEPDFDLRLARLSTAPCVVASSQRDGVCVEASLVAARWRREERCSRWRDPRVASVDFSREADMSVCPRFPKAHKKKGLGPTTNSHGERPTKTCL